MEGRNCIGAYKAEAEALADVRETLRYQGLPGVASLALGWEDERGELVAIAEGADLAARGAAAGGNLTAGRRCSGRLAWPGLGYHELSLAG